MDATQRSLSEARSLNSMQKLAQQDAAKEQLEARRQAAEEYKTSILKASLEPEAFERLRRVALVKPEKAQAAEAHLLNLCRAGQMQGKIDEATVRSVLERVNVLSRNNERQGAIQFRRKNCLDSDDDF